MANAHSYQVRVTTPDGKELKIVSSTQARSVVIAGLIPGIVYPLQACAIGGLTGSSDWSAPLSHMVI